MKLTREDVISKIEAGDTNYYMCDLSGLDLSGLDLSGANLEGAVLEGAVLDGANLTEANLFHANLTNAHLYEANLTEANLWFADLVGANLERANLTGAELRRSTLLGASLTSAKLSRTKLPINFGDIFRFGEETDKDPNLPNYSSFLVHRIDGNIIILLEQGTSRVVWKSARELVTLARGKGNL